MYMFISSNNPLPTLAWDWRGGLEEQATSGGRTVGQPHTRRKYFTKDLEDHFRWI